MSLINKCYPGTQTSFRWMLISKLPLFWSGLDYYLCCAYGRDENFANVPDRSQFSCLVFFTGYNRIRRCRICCSGSENKNPNHIKIFPCYSILTQGVTVFEGVRDYVTRKTARGCLFQIVEQNVIFYDNCRNSRALIG